MFSGSSGPSVDTAPLLQPTPPTTAPMPTAPASTGCGFKAAAACVVAIGHLDGDGERAQALFETSADARQIALSNGNRVSLAIFGNFLGAGGGGAKDAAQWTLDRRKDATLPTVAVLGDRDVCMIRLLLGAHAEVPLVRLDDDDAMLRRAAAALARKPPTSDASAYASAWKDAGARFLVAFDDVPEEQRGALIAMLALVKLEALAALACGGAFASSQRPGVLRTVVHDAAYHASPLLRCPRDDPSWLRRTLDGLIVDGALTEQGKALAPVAANVLAAVDDYGQRVLKPLLEAGEVAHVVARYGGNIIDSGGWDGIWLLYGGAESLAGGGNTIANCLPTRTENGTLAWRPTSEPSTAGAWAKALTAHWRAALATWDAEGVESEALGVWLELASGTHRCGPFFSPIESLPRPALATPRPASGAVAQPSALFGYTARRLNPGGGGGTPRLHSVCASVGTGQYVAILAACSRTMNALAPSPARPRAAPDEEISRALAEVRATVNAILATDAYGTWLPQMQGTIGPRCTIASEGANATPLRVTEWTLIEAARGASTAPSPAPLLVLLPDALLHYLFQNDAARRGGDRGEVGAVVQGTLVLPDADRVEMASVAPISEASTHAADVAGPRAWRLRQQAGAAAAATRIATAMRSDDLLSGLVIRVAATTPQLPPQKPMFVLQ